MGKFIIDEKLKIIFRALKHETSDKQFAIFNKSTNFEYTIDPKLLFNHRLISFEKGKRSHT